MNGLGVEKREKSVTDLVNERCVEMLGCTLDERSDENLRWMLENGYRIKHAHRRSRIRIRGLL